jgi:endonuclease-3
LPGKAKITTIEKIIKLLEQEYGSPEWRQREEPVAVLVGTILSQNTSDVNSVRAFNSLMSTFGSWEAIASAPVEHIAQAIRLGGLSRVKAVRIRQILEQIKREQSCISLDFLEAMNISEAKDYLMHLPGVGPKTASCVLLFALGKPCLPVDTHVFRVAKRLGLIASGVSVEQAHGLLQEQIPPSRVYQFHLQIIRHGRRICHARRPRCNECILESVCSSSLAS